MVFLAKAYPEQKTSREIAQQEDISGKYLERLLSILLRHNLIQSQQGKTGGYVLAKKPNLIKAGEIIEVLEGTIAPMRCVGKFCASEATCPSSKVWNELGQQIHKTLYRIKLSDLI